MDLRLYNTATRQKEVFTPLQEGRVGMYCCGPTVYNYAHVGNLRTYIFEDILRRTLVWAGYKVRHVMNVTDVGHLSDDGDDGEDKMIKAARQQGMSVWDIATMFTDAFFADTKRLGIQKPEVVCRATDHVADMIGLIRTLEEKGFTYVADGNVYFDIAKFEHYGDLALLDRQELRAGARVLVDQAKRNPGDFVLWFTNSKFQDQAMIWDSPWGRGYPGWHIECSAMSTKYLGPQFDIHCGGVDHIPVHHTNEIAQTECATGKSPWVKYWIHGEFLLMNKEKMAKSAGNFSTLQALVDQGYDPMDYRFFCLQAQYRTQLNYSPEAMAAARTGRLSLVDKVARLVERAGGAGALKAAQPAPDHGVPELAEFTTALFDDLNVPRAMAALNGVIRDEALTADLRLALVAAMDTVVGLGLVEAAKASLATAADVELPAEERQWLEAKIQARDGARKAKDWAESDRIRDEVLARGWLLKDGPQGTTWHRAP